MFDTKTGSDLHGVSCVPKLDVSTNDLGVRRSSRCLSTKAGYSVRFVDTVHSISTIESVGSTVSMVEESYASRKSFSSTNMKNYISGEPSLVKKLFNNEDDSMFVRPTLRAPKAKTKEPKRSDKLLPFVEDEEMKALPKKANFPRIADYIHRDFYELLVMKMRPKYGIETNARVVTLAHYIKAYVDKISGTDEQYPEHEINNFKRVLARQGIIETHYEFWFFCIKRLPAIFRQKAFPLFVHKNGNWQLRETTGWFDPILSDEARSVLNYL